MPLHRVQVALQDKSGLPRDQYVNTWYVTTPSALNEPEGIDIANVFIAFYNSLATAVLLSDVISGSATPSTVKIYEMADAKIRPIFAEATWHPPTGGGGAWPNEVATCLSLHGSAQPGVKVASTRGRVFLGPLSTGWSSPTPDGRPNPAKIAMALGFAKTLGEDIIALPTGPKIVVYSPKLQRVFPVERFTMDDAFDTQRSRGCDPTVQTNVIVTGGGGNGGPAN